MALSAWVGNKRFEIGTPSFFKAWFSTILVRLENDDWGSLYPIVMRELYSGSLSHARAIGALNELEQMQVRLSEYPPEQVVWDFEKREARPPWGNDISPHIISLGNYFVTSSGKDLFEILKEVFLESAKTRSDVVIT